MKKNNWKYQVGYTIGAIGGFTLGFIRGFITVGLIIIAIVLLLTGCLSEETKREIDERNEMYDTAVEIKSTMYETTSGENIEVVENLEGYRLVLWHNGYGSSMQILFHIESDSLWKQELGYEMD